MIFDLGPDAQEAYGKGRITPIWTDGGGYSIVAYHHEPDTRGYFRFDIETPKDIQPTAMNWQHILVAEFKSLWELGWPDDRLKKVAGWFRFRYIESLIAELAAGDMDTTEKDYAWQESFLKRIASDR